MVTARKTWLAATIPNQKPSLTLMITSFSYSETFISPHDPPARVTRSIGCALGHQGQRNTRFYVSEIGLSEGKGCRELLRMIQYNRATHVGWLIFFYQELCQRAWGGGAGRKYPPLRSLPALVFPIPCHQSSQQFTIQEWQFLRAFLSPNPLLPHRVLLHPRPPSLIQKLFKYVQQGAWKISGTLLDSLSDNADTLTNDNRFF